MAIQSNFPAIKPTLLLDFANTKQLDPRVTFTRASTGTFYGTQTAKAEENLLVQSQDFTTTWSVASQNATITANTTAAPDGTTTADTLTDDATSAAHRVSQTVTTSNTLQMVYSVFAKYSTMQWISISAATATGNWAGAKFDIQNGVLGSTSQQGSGFTANSSSITAVGNGWYRCVLVYTPGASGSTTMLVSGATDGTTFTTSQRGSEVYSGTGSAVFLWGAQLEQRSAVTAYTATTTQPITNYIPVLQTAASGVARFEHNPTTFESLGLEIEEQRTNLVTYSEVFTDAVWTKTRASITANTVVAPDGTLTGDALIENTDNNSHFLAQGYSATNTTLTFSAHVKAAGRSIIRFQFSNNSTGSAAVFFDISNGTISSAATNGGDFTNASAAITAIGNGWYRCSLTATKGSTNSDAWPYITLVSTGTTTSYAGNGFSGIFIWGAQLEAGAFPTSYIQTVASQVTRAADAANMTGTNFSSWYNAAEGTLYAEANHPATTGTGKTHEYVSLFSAAGNGYDLRVFNGTTRYAVQNTTTTLGNDTAGAFDKLVMGYSQQTTFAQSGSLNAAAAVSSTTSMTRALDSLAIGGGSGSNNLNGTIRKLAYYPLRVTNANLQALTS